MYSRSIPLVDFHSVALVIHDIHLLGLASAIDAVAVDAFELILIQPLVEVEICEIESSLAVTLFGSLSRKKEVAVER